jgi:2-aminoadipate transaminase
MPLAELCQAAAHRLPIADPSCYAYGPEQGGAEFRADLADFLTRHYGVPVQAGELLITAGASHALDLVLTRLCRPGDTIFVEDPTYFFALGIFADRHLRVVPVPTDPAGIDVDALELMLRTKVPRLLYTIPVFHNPTGVTLPEERRRRLAGLATEFGFLIVADEVYQLTGDLAAAPAPLRTFGPGQVLSLGSFSKILAPGIRLGWVEGPPDEINALQDCGVLRSGGGVAPVMCAIVSSAIQLGLQDSFLERACRIYSSRRQHMISCLSRELPAGVRFQVPHGGFYIWLELPASSDAVAMLAAGEASGVSFRAGPSFSPGQNFRNFMRLCFVFNEEKKLTDGVVRLAELIRSHW